jgi:CRP-like cAMP-binding protein
VCSHALQQGDAIVTQGTVSSDFYMIEEGICEVSISYFDDETGKQVQQLLCTMERGEHFGEMALLPGVLKPRSATVTAVTNVECLRLDRASFQRVIGA